ncbi:MAG: SMP-30/gluconolactonase/LRE family protein [Acidobacteriaceae bacterium]
MNPDPILNMAAFEIFAQGLDHAEGLAFDSDQNLWAGGELGQVYRIDANGSIKEIARLGGFCLGLTFSRQQDLFVCNSKLGALQQVDRSGRLLSSLDRVADRKLLTPNFSVFDSDGNLYFSDSGTWGRSNGCIYRLRANGKAEHFAGPFAFPNGLALSADETSLFIAQSLQDNVLRLPILSDGSAGQAEVFAEGLARVPDGLAFDGLGNLYVTCYATHNLYRVTPRREVALLAFDPLGTMLACPTNIAFGPADSEMMYVSNLARWHICRVRVGVRGQKLANQQPSKGSS